MKKCVSKVLSTVLILSMLCTPAFATETAPETAIPETAIETAIETTEEAGLIESQEIETQITTEETQGPVIETPAPDTETPETEPAQAQEKPLNIKQALLSMAEDADGKIKSGEEADNDEVFAAFVDNTFGTAMFSDPEIDLMASYNNAKKLSAPRKKAFNKIAAKFKAIALGQQTSTKIVLTSSDLGIGKTKRFTLKQLGLTSSASNQKIANALAKKALLYNPTADFTKIHNTLLADLPLHQFWYDKTIGFDFSASNINAGGDSRNGYWVTCTWTLRFKPAKAFKGSKTFSVSQTKIKKVQTAASNAKAVVKKYASKSDRAKLLAYKEYLCKNIDYNYDAVTDLSTPYGNPWQLIWAFDKDPSTKVVCEGYSKAFQYLCDLTTFKDSTISCYSVTGNSTFYYNGINTGGGPHMWNIVTRKGKKYLVDVTNCDSDDGVGDVGLFLKGKASGTVAKGYKVKSVNGLTVKYTYAADTKNIYTNKELTLADSAWK